MGTEKRQSFEFSRHQSLIATELSQQHRDALKNQMISKYGADIKKYTEKFQEPDTSAIIEDPDSLLRCLAIVAETETASRTFKPFPVDCVAQHADAALEGTVLQMKKFRDVGQGNFGTVASYLLNNGDNKLVAVKRVHLENHMTESAPQEMRAPCQLPVHENILRFLGFHLKEEMNEKWLLILTEYVPGITLHNVVKECDRFEERDIWHYTCQMASGLAHLHSNRIVHRDFKSPNIMVLGNGQIRIGDFGSSKVLKPQSRCKTTGVGTYYWTAPEVCLPGEENTYGKSCDIWSFGVTIYEMATKETLFPKLEGLAMALKLMKIAQKAESIPSVAIPGYSIDLQKIIVECLQADPSKRPGAIELQKSIAEVRNSCISFFQVLVDYFSAGYAHTSRMWDSLTAINGC